MDSRATVHVKGLDTLVETDLEQLPTLPLMRTVTCEQLPLLLTAFICLTAPQRDWSKAKCMLCSVQRKQDLWGLVARHASRLGLPDKPWEAGIGSDTRR